MIKYNTTRGHFVSYSTLSYSDELELRKTNSKKDNENSELKDKFVRGIFMKRKNKKK